jgi:threonyl-tRNA synthetase
MLQRIYGTAWYSAGDLEAYLNRLEEAEKRDHRKLGKELDLFSFHEVAGAGLPLYHPKGARVLRLLQEWLRRELYRRGYVEVITPHIYKADVWKISGHYDFYHDNMYFFEIDEGDGHVNEYAIKPMNCPGHVMIFDNEVRSYRDLPMRISEFGTVYRHEMSGVVHGLMRARGFTQDDAHIFCEPSQVHDEVIAMLDLVDYVMHDVFGFEYSAEISTRPIGHSIGAEEMWDLATNSLKEACEAKGLPYEINEGDGAFYGPKIDIKLKDAIGRTWQCSTIQVDFNFPERFGLKYRTAENTEAVPFMLHRTILGSMERFFGILIEHYAGAFPTWLAPVQVVVIPIADRHLDYANDVRAKLEARGVRVEVYSDNEPMRIKIAKAQQQKVPYMLVVGDKEAESGQVGVRERTAGDLGARTIEELVAMVKEGDPLVG